MVSKRILTIEIGHLNTRICEMNYRKQNRPVIYRAVSIKNPDNCLSDGYIRNTSELGEYLNRKLKIAGMKKSDVVFTIASNKIMSREIEIPAVKDAFISRVVSAQADEYLPIDTTDYIISYTVLEKDKLNHKIKLMIFAAPKDLVNDYYQLAESMGVKIESIDYVGNSSYQWLKRVIKDEAGLVVNIDSVTTLATILDNGKLMLQRNIITGTELLLHKDNFDGKFSFYSKDEESRLFSDVQEDNDEYVSPYGNTVTEQPANPILDENEDENEKEHFPNKQEISQSEIDMLIGSLSRIIEYHTNSKKGNKVSKIYITGEGALLQGIDELMEKAMGIPTESVKKLPGVFFKGNAREPSLDNQSSCYIACAGAALAPIDLIPYELADYEQKKYDMRTYFLMLGLVAGACIFVIAICQLHYMGVKNESAQIQRQINQEQYITKVYQSYLEAEEEYKYIQALDHATETNNENLNDLFNQLEGKLPRDAEITSMTSAGDDFSMSFNVTSKPVAAKVLMQLKQIDYVEKVSISEVNAEEIVTFQVTCNYSTFKALMTGNLDNEATINTDSAAEVKKND